MYQETIVFIIFLIFAGAALLSTVALYTRQSLLVAYILVGMILGPSGLGWVADHVLVQQIGDIGILFLLFLLGLHLQPQNLFQMLSKVTWITLLSSLVFAGLGYGIGSYYGFSNTESLVIGAAMMFSSTIIGLKLLPSSVLHHQHTGEVMISILLMQDFIAIIVLLVLHGAGSGKFSLADLGLIVVALPALFTFAFLFERFILVKLLARFDSTQEYIFLLSVGWCLGIAELAGIIGLSPEIGAFIAGVSLATSPISLYIADSLKPLRDFFLVMFFFAIGASFEFQFLKVIIVPAVILAVLILIIKPLLYSVLLRWGGEPKSVANEVGVRLGQASEFSLLVAALAVNSALLSKTANSLVQATTILTFIVSTYLVMWRYPTPIAFVDKMRQD